MEKNDILKTIIAYHINQIWQIDKYGLAILGYDIKRK